jgi:hypothetical protein
MIEAQTENVVRAIRTGFGRCPYPGDAYLQGSFEGCEPYDEVGPFMGVTDWSLLEPAFLDAHYCALGFFSEAGFRFFLPAYMIADVRRQLLTADPAFYLTHGFSDQSHEEPQPDGTTVLHRWGQSLLLNPRRYGAITWYDYARYRLSVFPREEATAIVAYLSWKRDAETGDERARQTIAAALSAFWVDRAANAPSAETLAPGST